jgi:hypothetical protein
MMASYYELEERVRYLRGACEKDEKRIAALEASNQKMRDDFDVTWATKNNLIDKLREGLIRLQWANHNFCPSCHGINPKDTQEARTYKPEEVGHKKGCSLAELLKEE